MRVDVIVGGLYGDEGKGKIVSNLGKNYDYIFRVNASTNASHTVVLEDGKSFVTKQLPSVFGKENIKFVVAPGAVLNLHALRLELESRNDLYKIYNNITIASSISLLINPYIDRNKSQNHSKKYGSTNQGTGNAVIARDARHSVKLIDIKNVINNNISFDMLVGKIKESCYELDKSFYQDKKDDYFKLEAESLIEDFIQIEKMIGSFCKDYSNFLYNIESSANVLIEGCNGIMLDNLHGLNPFTTSASTSINSLLNGANISPYYLNEMYVIITGYFCCLNKRPFLTEMDEKDANKLYKYNSEVDDAENMKRRLGWFDLPTLKKSLIGHKNAKLILNKLDIMQDLEVVKVCDYYLNDMNEKIYVMPDDVEELKKLKPHYIEFKGWGNIDNINKNNIPKELKEYINYIEKETKEKIAFIGIGRKDKDLIKL
ncbi:MAG: adenylosuccinate synthetase [Bacilli bacterium]|nr:adenylosuccinate synthetase [Bacilli bacterium]